MGLTRSVLFFAIKPGRRDEFVAGFRRLAVLRRASRQPGFRRAQLHVPVDGGGGEAAGPPGADRKFRASDL
jgi:hypothetical protein